MIARCPECQTRYRIAREKIGPAGARIRCSKCSEIFRVEPPVDVESEPAATAGAPTRCLIAEADADGAKKIDAFLRDWKIETVIVADGADALLRIHRVKPQLVVLGSSLPSVAAPAVTEIVKRTAELAGVKLVRIGPAAEAAGAAEFEADHTLEPADLPEGLAPILERLGLGTRPPPESQTPVAKAPAPSPAVTPTPAKPTPPAKPGEADEVAAAERLARIIVSDIILYNDEKFARGAQDGNVVELLEAELVEASALFKRRVSEELREGCDFLVEELERRAAKKR